MDWYQRKPRFLDSFCYFLTLMLICQILMKSILPKLDPFEFLDVQGQTFIVFQSKVYSIFPLFITIGASLRFI